MPTATPFTFFGNQTLSGGTPTLTDGVLFNGFPFFTEKVDVSGFDYWVTLGGTQKGNTPTQAQIDLSWDNAVKLYWNLYGYQYTLTDFFVGEPTTVITPDADNDLDEGTAEPKDRQCEDVNEKFGMSLEATSEPFSRSNFYGTYGGLVRMYDGATTSQSNFVGYGIKSPDDVSDFGTSADWGITAFSGIGNGSGFVAAISYANEGGSGSELDYATLSNIDVLGYVDTTGTPDASALFASWDEGGGVTATITIDSLEFYTY